MKAPAGPAPEILVVDDDEGLRLLVSDCLRTEGYEVAVAASGAAAVAALRDRRPDLMLLDLQLDDMPGSALLEALRKTDRKVPFIVITGQGDQNVAVEMMKRGALDYVMKDAAILDLLPSVVKRAIATLERDRSLASAMSEKRALEQRILELGETERRRIGADLHDGVGQLLTAAELMCVGLKDDVAALDARLGGQLGTIAGMLRDAIAQTRALARGLAPLDEEPEAFQNGLTELAARAESIGRLKVRLDCRCAEPLRDRAAAGHLYRIAQEALHNAVKHSGATEVLIRWEKADGRFRLDVSDNGKGMLRSPSDGLGLGLMQHRADLIGAKLTLESRPGGGVTVTCLLPSKS